MPINRLQEIDRINSKIAQQQQIQRSYLQYLLQLMQCFENL